MKKIMLITASVILGLLVIAMSLMAFNGILPIGMGLQKPVFHKNNVALDGYDVTSYFSNEPTKGSPEYSFQMDGVTWQFSSQAQMEAFKQQPLKFLPQYGGYCAKAVSTGFTAPADPTVYSLRNQKLYIFSDYKVKEEFLKNPEPMITACNKKWK